MFESRTRLLVAKGRKLKDLDRAELERLVIGSSGKLRAPTLIRGKRVMVGHDEDGYTAFLA